MKKLHYWIMRNKENCTYHLRAKTKKEVVSMAKNFNKEDYDEPKIVYAEYSDLINLLNIVLGEGGEGTATYNSEKGNQN